MEAVRRALDQREAHRQVRLVLDELDAVALARSAVSEPREAGEVAGDPRGGREMEARMVPVVHRPERHTEHQRDEGEEGGGDTEESDHTTSNKHASCQGPFSDCGA